MAGYKYLFIFLVIFSLFVLAVCTNDETNNTKSSTGNDEDNAGLGLDFVRIKPGNSFYAIATLTTQDGQPPAEQNVEIQTSRGSILSATNKEAGSYRVEIVPDEIGTGEYRVTATFKDQQVTKTALVLSEVNDRWGQPMKIDSPVSTRGWEDSITITPDGQWLFLMYIPLPIDCAFTGDPNDPLCQNAVGPYSAPERPDMPGANRIDDNGIVHHGCPSLNFNSPPFPVPPIGIYGFRRLDDGVFGKPFVLSFQGDDGCLAPWGPSVLSNDETKATIFFAYDDPTTEGDADTECDIFYGTIQLGQNNNLGNYYINREGQISVDQFALTLLPLDQPGRQGNPSIYADTDGNILSVWVDDETAAENQQQIYAFEHTGDFPGGSWEGQTLLPAPISTDNTQDIQPFFNGEEALWRQGDSIATSKYLGGSIFDTDSWGDLQMALVPDPYNSAVGAVRTLGEPNYADVDGVKELYFVYGVYAEDGTLDLNVGWIKEE